MAGEPNIDVEQLNAVIETEATRSAEITPSYIAIADLVSDFHNEREGAQEEQVRVAAEKAPTEGAEAVDLAAHRAQREAASAEPDIEKATQTPGGALAFSTDLYARFGGKRVA